MQAALLLGLEDPAVDICSTAFAEGLDAADRIPGTAALFALPVTHAGAVFRTAGSAAVYLCGNSLGLQPKRTQPYVLEELQKWAALGVEGHFRTERPWAEVEDTILIEEHAFPSDTYAVKSQLLVHGFDPASLIAVGPRLGEETIREEDVLAAIRAAGDTLALVLWPGVQYYTGQAFDLAPLCAAAHAVGAVFGADLAHAVGNIALQLHDWDVDFAAWCSYKYLNAGPGGIAGAFVHSRFAAEPAEARPYFAGWWGHKREGRFQMGDAFEPHPDKTAARLQLSNPAVLPMAALRASLDVFVEAVGGVKTDPVTSEVTASAPAVADEGIGAPHFVSPLREKSLALTGYLEALLVREFGARPSLASEGGAEPAAATTTEAVPEVTIITPADPARRGCQLSLVFKRPVREIYQRLSREGVIVDMREPHVIRVAPVPLYNTAVDVLEFVTTLKMVLAELD